MYTMHVLINISLRSTRFCDIYCNQILLYAFASAPEAFLLLPKLRVF